MFGSHGALRIFHYANHLYLRTKQGLQQIRVEDTPMPAQFGAELSSFARSIRQGTDIEVPGEIGRRALQLILGAYESMKTGQRVTV